MLTVFDLSNLQQNALILMAIWNYNNFNCAMARRILNLSLTPIILLAIAILPNFIFSHLCFKGPS